MTSVRIHAVIVLIAFCFVAFTRCEIHESSIRKQSFIAIRLEKLVKGIEKQKVPSFFKRSADSKPINPRGPAVFADAMDVNLGAFKANSFAGTLRHTGFVGDIVVSVAPGSKEGFLRALKSANCISFIVETVKKIGEIDTYRFKDMTFPGAPKGYPLGILRLYMYKWWASFYSPGAILMFADFQNVFFQSNPFKYKKEWWMPPRYHMAVFNENFPQKMIYRSSMNTAWIEACYGQSVLRELEHNFVSSSGVLMGTRDAMLAYVSCMSANKTSLLSVLIMHLFTLCTTSF